MIPILSDIFDTVCSTSSTDIYFAVTGVLYNTEPLDYSKRRNYILEVKVEDCGGQRSRTSDKVMVNIVVKEECNAGWKGKLHFDLQFCYPVQILSACPCI